VGQGDQKTFWRSLTGLEAARLRLENMAAAGELEIMGRRDCAALPAYGMLRGLKFCAW